VSKRTTCFKEGLVILKLTCHDTALCTRFIWTWSFWIKKIETDVWKHNVYRK